jgi:uncharacterized coiled-coil protein SlyX
MMAARRQTIDEATLDGVANRAAARAAAVVAEQMQSHFRAFGEALEVLREQTARGFAGVEQRLDRLEAVVLQHERHLRNVNAQLAELRAAVDKKVDRDEVESIVERAVARAVSH